MSMHWVNDRAERGVEGPEDRTQAISWGKWEDGWGIGIHKQNYQKEAAKESSLEAANVANCNGSIAAK